MTNMTSFIITNCTECPSVADCIKLTVKKKSYIIKAAEDDGMTEYMGACRS